MSEVKDGLTNVSSCLDDVKIYSEYEEDHCEHLQALSDYRLTLNPKKCIIGKKELDFLGHHITQHGFQRLRTR